jgi:hypothetical protein
VMNHWPKFINRFLFVLAWLFLISLPMVAFLLAAGQQIQIGGDESSHLRIFLLAENDAEGIGVELVRPFPSSPPCFKTNVRYFLWSGTGENVSFCQCLDPQANGFLPATAGDCATP